MTLSTAATVALYIVLAFVIIFGILTVALLGVLAFALRAVRLKLEHGLARMEPLLEKAMETLDIVQRVTNNVGTRADTILKRGEDLTEEVSRKVESTASVFHKAVSIPLIKVSSVVSGLSEGLSSLGRHFGGSHGNNSKKKGMSSNGRE